MYLWWLQIINNVGKFVISGARSTLYFSKAKQILNVCFLLNNKINWGWVRCWFGVGFVVGVGVGVGNGFGVGFGVGIGS